MKPARAEPPAYTELSNYVSERAVIVRATTERVRNEDFSYARKCIRTTWVIAALFTAMFAFAARQPLFHVPPALIQVLAVTVNGLIWWLATRFIWFTPPKQRKRK